MKSNNIQHSPILQDGLTKRKARLPTDGDEEESMLFGLSDEDDKFHKQSAEKWKRILLLVIAITVHNIPGNLAFYVICNINSLCQSKFST